MTIDDMPVLANGFLPTRGSFTLDLVAVAMIAVVIALLFSIVQVRIYGNKKLHRAVQLTTAALLTITLIAFEVDVRIFTDWRELAKPSPYYDSGLVHWCLAIHLCFAIPTPIAWGIVIWTALRGFKSGFEQGTFNKFHRTSGRIAATLMFITAITGWIFYYVAFIA